MCGRPETRTIRRNVLSVHVESVVGAARIAAVHQVEGGFRLPTTALDSTASVDSQSSDRAY